MDLIRVWSIDEATYNKLTIPFFRILPSLTEQKLRGSMILQLTWLDQRAYWKNRMN